ncbi:MAG: hypothetical protein ACLVKK_12895 [Ruthenibacterium sp.]
MSPAEYRKRARAARPRRCSHGGTGYDCQALRLKRPFEVDEVVCTILNMPAPLHEGEQHDFWEFLYVDKGELYAGSRELTMKRQMIFHEPGSFTACAQRMVALNLVVMSLCAAAPPWPALPGAFHRRRRAEYWRASSKRQMRLFRSAERPGYTKQFARAARAAGAEQ